MAARQGGDGADGGGGGGREGRGWRRWAPLLLLPLAAILALAIRSCMAGDVQEPHNEERVYEEDRRRNPDGAPDGDGRRLSLAISEEYRISDGEPCLYIGLPEDNVYDVVFTLRDAAGRELHRTGYVAPGTTVAIDGTAFLQRGDQKVDCAVSVYERGTGALVSDCATVVLNVSYR